MYSRFAQRDDFEFILSDEMRASMETYAEEYAVKRQCTCYVCNCIDICVLHASMVNHDGKTICTYMYSLILSKYLRHGMPIVWESREQVQVLLSLSNGFLCVHAFNSILFVVFACSLLCVFMCPPFYIFRLWKRLPARGLEKTQAYLPKSGSGVGCRKWRITNQMYKYFAYTAFNWALEFHLQGGLSERQI